MDNGFIGRVFLLLSSRFTQGRDRELKAEVDSSRALSSIDYLEWPISNMFLARSF